MHLAQNAYPFKRMASILKVKAQGESTLWGGVALIKKMYFFLGIFWYILGTSFSILINI
jgi:hypothetical protein